MRLVFVTSKIVHIGKEELDQLRAKGPVVFVLWHGQFFPYIAYAAKHCKGLNVLTSLSDDGEVLSRVIHNFGSYVVRGDERRRGAAGLVQMIKKAKQGRDVLFAADGPIGPRHILKSGVLLCAMKSGVPIVPVACSATKKHTFCKSWDRFFAPYPFGQMFVSFGSPFCVRPQQKGVAIDELCLLLEDKLKRLSEETKRLAEVGE